jgi:hypothetical protein
MGFLLDFFFLTGFSFLGFGGAGSSAGGLGDFLGHRDGRLSSDSRFWAVW